MKQTHVQRGNKLEIQKVAPLEVVNQNKGTEKIHTNQNQDKKIDNTESNSQGETNAKQETRNNPQRTKKKLKLEGNGELTIERKRSRSRKAIPKKKEK